MSSEIRAGDNRTYWIIGNGNSFVDGVTDPDLVTTVGNGWYVVWIGSNYTEYVKACSDNNIIPRNTNPDTPTTTYILNDKLSARQVRLWLLHRGINLESVDMAINNIEDSKIRDSVRIEWEYAPYIERSHPMLAPLAQTLGLSKGDIDSAFTEGANL